MTLVCATGLLMLPASAWATDGSPVHVDPKSPVAKEYALPLASARGAAPESGKGGRLFGAGIRHGSKTVDARHLAGPHPDGDEQRDATADPPDADRTADLSAKRLSANFRSANCHSAERAQVGAEPDHGACPLYDGRHHHDHTPDGAAARHHRHTPCADRDDRRS